MANRDHHYRVRLTWAGNNHASTTSFRNRDRSYLLHAEGKPPITGSSDAVFRGDSTRWNPEDLLVASLSACHQLWYLGLCAAAGIAVTEYEDDAEGTMTEDTASGAGQFKEVILRPRVTLASGSDQARAEALHHTAHDKCFIARSVNFPVRCQPVVSIAAAES